MRKGKDRLSEHGFISSRTIILSRVTPFLLVYRIRDPHKIEFVNRDPLERVRNHSFPEDEGRCLNQFMGIQFKEFSVYREL